MSDLLPVYAPAPVAPVRGERLWLFEADGTRWLDCIGGVATNALGHCHPDLVATLQRQSTQLWHVSNALRIEGQEALAARITQSCFADKVFFCNTGTEAVECAIKMVRKYHAVRGDADRIDMVPAITASSADLQSRRAGRREGLHASYRVSFLYLIRCG